jgi:peptide/nickel transport system permease protein
LTANEQTPPAHPRARPVLGAVRYLAGKALTIALTIFIGVFITVMIANQPSRRGLGPPVSPFETSLEAQIYLVIRSNINNGTIDLDRNGVPDQDQVQALTDQLRTEMGLNLPFLPRYMLWTIKALTFDWGQLGARQGGWGAQRTTAGVNDIIALYLPHTLLLVATAYLLVFLIGMPLSLYLARNYGSRADRLFAILSPISSVPSWVFAILLISIFAFQLRWLPFGAMFDYPIPENPIEYVLNLSRHLILPVSAIALSLLFQVVYAWRTFFIIYSDEDYVELARAKGLPSNVLERQYILRPALPYVITSFVTTLISFWQLSMALEVIFRWPGLGWLYIKEALPNFWGESMEPGELIIAVGIVVIFAYLLGAVVFILDIVYVIVDPRIRLLRADKEMQAQERVKSRGARWRRRFKTWTKGRDQDYGIKAQSPAKRRKISWAQVTGNFKGSILDLRERSRLFFQELRRYPSAIFGLTVIVLLLAGSIYAVIALPYAQVGKDYEQKRMPGRSYIPRTAMPEWVNLFSNPPRLSTLIMDQNSKEANGSIRTLDNGWIEKTITFTFEYPYRETPSEIFLYFDPIYKEKLPFVTLEWQYPDGRSLELRRTIAEPSSSYDFGSSIIPLQLLNQYPEWKNWFLITGQYTTPVFTLLFAEPGSAQPAPQHGTYQLTIKSLLFEQDSDLQVQFVLLGQVYGLAGTDYGRRDLIVPLFWGMPFALLIGLLGTLITTLVAMLLPAIGVWFGGWVDNLIQRFTEINMVLPSLMIAVLANVLFNINIWIILGIVVVINAFGSPIKIIRSALLQAKEAPYIESARSYGASNFRIITKYILPRIMPVLIPQLVTQVPSFIFWEATLGFFNIKSIYPSWGRIIYDGLANGALYGSPFWVLEPISLLLLTSLAFAMLGSALERILNPRIIDTIPVAKDESKQEVDRADARQRKGLRLLFDRRVIIGLIAVVVLFIAGKILTSAAINFMVPSQATEPRESKNTLTAATSKSIPVTASSPTEMPASVPETLSITPTLTPTATVVVSEPTLMPSPVDSRPVTYTLRPGEFPYCIARRFNVAPNELLALNGLGNHQVFYAGTVLQIPQTGNHFPGNRMLRSHPTTYTVARQNETLYGVACLFGDIDPVIIAQANNFSVDSTLFVGQQLTIP